MKDKIIKINIMEAYLKTIKGGKQFNSTAKITPFTFLKTHCCWLSKMINWTLQFGLIICPTFCDPCIVIYRDIKTEIGTKTHILNRKTWHLKFQTVTSSVNSCIESLYTYRITIWPNILGIYHMVGCGVLVCICVRIGLIILII